jgi:hypothetical protein
VLASFSRTAHARFFKELKAAPTHRKWFGSVIGSLGWQQQSACQDVIATGETRSAAMPGSADSTDVPPMLTHRRSLRRGGSAAKIERYFSA